MAVVNMLVGAVTPAGGAFAVKVDGGGPVRVAVADNEAMSGPTFTASQAVDAQGVAKVSIAGLPADTRWWWQVEDNGVRDTSITGRFLTDPPAGLPASFTIAAASCAGLDSSFPGSGGELAPDRLSNHPVFDTIRTRALAERWRRFAHLGDLHYYDLGSGSHGIVGGGSLANYRAGYDDTLAQSNQAGLYREVPLAYIWDDHDFGPNDSDGTLATKGNAASVYRERVPHPNLPAGGGANPIYHGDDIGRVLFVASDVRFDRSPNGDPAGPDKTMLGAAQKSWLEGVLAGSDAKLFVWLMGSQWLGTSSDGWASFTHERDELVQLLGDTGWLGRMCMIYGDRHAAGIDSGGSNLWGGFPILQAASLDSTFSEPVVGQFDVLDDNPGRNRYGTIAVNDIGSVLTVRLTAWNGLTELGAHQFTVPGDPPPPIATGALARTLAGSHTVRIEARVVGGHQTGPDPDGVELPVVGGQVVLDGTADVRGSLTLLTPGRTDTTGLSTFPRLTSDLLSPHGNEIFVRYGVDLGGAGFIWTPLGYYRITRPAQSTTPFGDLQITGQDRMAGLIRADLLRPRTYAATRTLGNIAMELIEEVYPDATIVWDDDTNQVPIGRVLTVEDSRYQALRDIAGSHGKLFYVDGQGFFRFQVAPDDTPVWQVRAGRDGVLVNGARAVTSDDVFNGVILTGQGADDIPAVQAIAIDNNPASPTYFFGPFGQSVRRVESPLVNGQADAEAAVLLELVQSLGTPYEFDFSAVPNATLEPWQVIEAVHADGNREPYTLERIVIPLRPGDLMTGAGRTRIVASVGSLLP